jgi:uncharacterized protein YqcC (DUF446 family)
MSPGKGREEMTMTIKDAKSLLLELKQHYVYNKPYTIDTADEMELLEWVFNQAEKALKEGARS